MPLTPLPTAPSRDRPATFSSEANALLGALPGFVDELNTVAIGESAAGLALTLRGLGATEGPGALGFGATAAYARATAGYRLALDRVFVTDSPFSADNTNTVDAAASIQAAIDSVPPYTTAFGLFTKEIFIPPGKYKLTTSVLHRNGVIINADRGAEFYVTGNFPAFAQSANTSVLGSRTYSSIGLKGLNIVGTNGTTNNAGAGLLNGNLSSQHGIKLANDDQFNSASYLFIKNTFVYNCGGHGLYIHKPTVSNSQWGWTQFGHFSDLTLQACGGYGMYVDGVTGTADFSSMETKRIHVQGCYGGGVYINGGNDNKLRFTVNNTGTCVTPSGTFTNTALLTGPSIQLENQLNTQVWGHIENNNSGEGLVIGRTGLCHAIKVEGLFYTLTKPIQTFAVNGIEFDHLFFGSIGAGNTCIATSSSTRYAHVGKEWFKDTSTSIFFSDGNAGTTFAATGYLGTQALGFGPTAQLYGGVTSTNGDAIGYGTGSGQAVSQSTSKATTVTSNTITGQITTFNDALAANTTVVFALNCSKMAVGDTVGINISSGPASPQNYQVWPARVGAGFAVIAIRNISAGSLSEALVLNYTITKGAIS
jgi:hypothetical protein